MVTNQSADFEIFLGGPNVMPSTLISGRGKQTAEKQRAGTWLSVACFEDGRIGLEAKGCRWPLKAGNCERTDYSSAPPESKAGDYSPRRHLVIVRCDRF